MASNRFVNIVILNAVKDLKILRYAQNDNKRWIAALLALLAMTSSASAQVTPPIKHNNAPIDITADKLEVFQEENRAIFSGHVVAIQADTRLTAEKMTVHYTKQENAAGDKEAKKTNSKKQDNVTQGAIRKIEVEENVFLSTPTQTASGANGVYDVEHQEIILNGNVVLTKDKNTLKGDRLTYDMNTGKSVISSDNQPVATTTAADGKKPRVRALFVPDKKEEAKPAATPTPQGPKTP